MLEHQQHVVFLIAFVMQFVGLASADVTRLGENCRGRICWNGLFVLCMLAMTAVTILAILNSSGYWLSYGATLALMSMIATVDFRRPAHASV